jgi:hypothetical protein
VLDSRRTEAWLHLQVFHFCISRQDLQLKPGDPLVEIGIAHRHRNRVMDDLWTDGGRDGFRL